MNSLVVAAVGLAGLWLGYRYYGSLMERLWGADPSRRTPAHEREDGVDYVPARHWTVLFGHHFASIAGAGPIIGPVIACAIWGWLPAVVWIVLGSVFIGAVHDFASLMLSLRQKGRSISDVAESVMGYRSKIILASFLWISLTLVIAVFAAVGAKTLEQKPEVAAPTFGLILVAVLVGLMMYRWRVNQIAATLVGIGLLFGLILLGHRFPVSLGADSAGTWTVILLVYSYAASVLPVHILLQPRDYLATFILFFGLFSGYLGLLLSHPVMQAPAFIAPRMSEMPMWPMMFVIVACGAVSGFHCLISGGTTSKQLGSEAHAKRIGFGAMILEGALAILALLCVSAGLYWVCGGGECGGLVYPELMKEKGWIVAFGVGFSRITEPIFGEYGALIAITVLNAFVITTLDTATRVGRYITEELFAEGLGWGGMRNRFLSTAILMIPVAYLSLGAWRNIWPMFGASNQLVAALALIVASVSLLAKGKPTKYTLYPALLMLITTLAALVYQVFEFFPQGKYLLGSVGIVLLLLALFMMSEAWSAVRRLRESRGSRQASA
ncbi:MAG: carbon starvation protein A [Elusimicrobiota bacterium]